MAPEAGNSAFAPSPPNDSPAGGAVVDNAPKPGKRWLKRVIVLLVCCVVALLLLSLIFSRVDYSRVENGKRPMFSTPTLAMPDGGSVRWHGLGYRLTVMHRIAGPYDADGRFTAHTVGPVLEYWIPVWPFRNRENTWRQPVASSPADSHYWTLKKARKARGESRDGKPYAGAFYDWWTTDQKALVTYSEGKRHGVAMAWYENGQLRWTGAHACDLRTGTWRHWDTKGKLIASGTYKNGKPWDGTFLESFKPPMRYKDGVKQGPERGLALLDRLTPIARDCLLGGKKGPLPEKVWAPFVREANERGDLIDAVITRSRGAANDFVDAARYKKGMVWGMKGRPVFHGQPGKGPEGWRAQVQEVRGFVTVGETTVPVRFFQKRILVPGKPAFEYGKATIILREKEQKKPPQAAAEAPKKIKAAQEKKK